jgi:hypothetical protein
MISTYDAAKKYMSRARSPLCGRALTSVAWRLSQCGSEYAVTVYGVEVGRFFPDNTFMFTLDGSKAHRVAQTLSITLHRNLPFWWQRFGKQLYRVNHHNHTNGRILKSAPQVYDGLRFDLSTGECLNYKPDPTQRVNPDRRKEWLAACKTWKRKMKVAARLGAFDALIRQEMTDRTPWAHRIRWRTKQGIDTLYKVIKDNDCSVEAMRMFVIGMIDTTGYFSGLTSQDVYTYIERLVNNNSIELRKRFGVFEGE